MTGLCSITTASVDEKNHVLSSIHGDDRYFAFSKYNGQFRDDWIGHGVLAGLSEKIIIGMSMFACIISLDYTNSLDIDSPSISSKKRTPDLISLP
jgi:hypothetical protein